MKRIQYFAAAALAMVLLVGLVVTPVNAASSTQQRLALQRAASTPVNATIYITTATLAPIFQSRLDQQVPISVGNAITGIVSTLPPQAQGWAQQMATTLLQPSATLTGLTTQQGGLVASLRLSLYPGDPQPIDANMLVTLSVANSSTVQVSVKPLSGSPALVNGPLATFSIPIGQLTSIATTPNCGSSALAVSLQLPVALGQTASQSQGQQTVVNAPVNQSSALHAHNESGWGVRVMPASTSSYVELPAASLASIGNGIGDLPITSNLTAKNIQIGVQGSGLLIDSDIYDSFWGRIATAETTVAPTASGGSLAVQVLNTTIKLFGLFDIPYNSYNQQIQQTLNSKLNSALTGKFYVTNAAIGPNASVPCTAGDSLVLTGTAYLG